MSESIIIQVLTAPDGNTSTLTPSKNLSEACFFGCHQETKSCGYVGQILGEGSIDILVNNAGSGYYVALKDVP